jgi:hypothetical protein
MNQKYELYELIVKIQRLCELRHDQPWAGLVEEVEALGGIFIDFTDEKTVFARIGFNSELERTQFLMKM